MQQEKNGYSMLARTCIFKCSIKASSFQGLRLVTATPDEAPVTWALSKMEGRIG